MSLFSLGQLKLSFKNYYKMEERHITYIINLNKTPSNFKTGLTNNVPIKYNTTITNARHVDVIEPIPFKKAQCI